MLRLSPSVKKSLSFASRSILVVRCLVVPTLCSLLPVGVQAQIDYKVEAQAIGTTKGVVPFWMRSNQHGSIPTTGISSSILGSARKDYTIIEDTSQRKKSWDWGMSLEGRANFNSSNKELTLIEGYLKAKMGPFELKAGRIKETMGLTGDTLLTSGSFAVSGNALGIPKVAISIPEYYSLPLLDSLFAFKGTFAHGWVGETPLQAKESLVKSANTVFHQKSLYVAMGKPNWKLRLFGGFNHQVYWGNEKQIYGKDFTLSPTETLLYVLLGKKYGSRETVAASKIGNQVGSIDLGASYAFNSLVIEIYRQNFYDVGALYYLANLRDGLNGVVISNTKTIYRNANWRKILFEFLYTKNQAGEIWSKLTKSGDENYYNNYMYKEGYSFKQKGIGTPLITTNESSRDGLLSPEKNFFNNNRVIAFHLGFEGTYKEWLVRAKVTASENFGTFDTSRWGSSIGSTRNPSYGIFGAHNQLSTNIELQRLFQNQFSVGCITSIDRGSLLDKSAGVIIKATKSF